MAEARTERIDAGAGLQGAQDIIENQSNFWLILLLVAHLPVDQRVYHAVVVVVLHIEVLAHEAGGLVVVDRVRDHEHVVEVLVAVERLVQQQVADDGALAGLDGRDHEHAGGRLGQVWVQRLDLVGGRVPHLEDALAVAQELHGKYGR